MNWLNRLERFKSEHIYAAYMKNKCDMENPADEEDEVADLWEMHWDQVILSSVQLGKGVYGEVYKGGWKAGNYLVFYIFRQID